MNPTYFKHKVAIPMDRIPDSTEKDGKPFLTIECYYMKDSYNRGYKLSINRVVSRGGFTSYMPMSKYNGLLHMEDAKRKNDKRGKEIGAALATVVDDIEKIAMHGDEPDWHMVFPILKSAGIGA